MFFSKSGLSLLLKGGGNDILPTSQKKYLLHFLQRRFNIAILMASIADKPCLKQVFKENWGWFLEKHGTSIPWYVVREVDKMLSCCDPEKAGYHKFVCEDHPEQVVVRPHSCKSKFCSRCSKITADKWVEKAAKWLPRCPYWHITFTVPKQLRPYFLFHPCLREAMFRAGADTVLSWFKERSVLPAVISAFHNHGRDVKHHPHLHMVVSCGGLNLKTNKGWVEQEFIPYRMLRKRWKTKLLPALSALLDDYNFDDLKQKLFSINWYVNVGLKKMSPWATLKYIGHYARKPVIANSRIVSYDRCSVCFSYHDFRDGIETKLTLPVERFMSLLIQHISPPEFRSIRYCGLLSNRGKGKWLALLRGGIGIGLWQTRVLYWRERQKKFKKRDPLKCPVCGKEMVLQEVAFPNKFGGLTVIKVN